MVGRGECAIIDPYDCTPEDGATFLTLTTRGNFRIASARQIGGDWYAAMPNYRRVGGRIVGPIAEDFFARHILGRVVGALRAMQ